MSDRAQLVEPRPVNWDLVELNDIDNAVYVNYLNSGLGTSDPNMFKRTGWSLPVGSKPRFMAVQPSLRPLNVRTVRYHAPGGRQSDFDRYKVLTAAYGPEGPPGYINDDIRVNPKPDNYYGSLF